MTTTPEPDPLAYEDDVEPDPEGTVPGEEMTPADPEELVPSEHAADWPSEHGGEA